jgi:hypothetical protein
MSNPELGLTGKGVERVQIKAVDAAIMRYVAARDERMELTKNEVDTKTALIKLLRDNADKIGVVKVGDDEVITYRHDELIVTLKHGKDDLKVRTETGDGGEEE